MLIREMQLADLQQVMEIENEAFRDHWKVSAYEYELNENEYSTLLVCEENHQIIGVCGYYHLFEDAQVITIATHCDWRQRGIGQMMLNAMIDGANQAGCCTFSLEVRVSNFAAIEMYKKNEFIEMNIRKSYYEDGEDAYFMMRALGGNYV